MKVIITGVTGMVGEGVLHQCTLDTAITEVLVLTRKPSGYAHPKVKDLLVPNFYDISALVSQLSGYDDCLFCLGTTSVGKSDEEFYKIAYTLTMSVANTLVKVNPAMTFCYISGSGTDSTEKGLIAWARTKGKTENDLLKLPFKAIYNFRPGYLHPIAGLKNTLSMYKYVSWMYPFLRLIGPKYFSTLADLGKAMIYVSKHGYTKNTIEVADINAIAKKV